MLFVITEIQGLQCKLDTFHKLREEILGMVASPRTCPHRWGAFCQHGGHMQEEKVLFSVTGNHFPSRPSCFTSTAGGNSAAWKAPRCWGQAAVPRCHPSRWHSGRWGDTSSVPGGETRALPVSLVKWHPGRCLRFLCCAVPQLWSQSPNRDVRTEALSWSHRRSEAREEPGLGDAVPQLWQIHVLQFHNHVCFLA